jgi:hypothetical protein
MHNLIKWLRKWARKWALRCQKENCAPVAEDDRASVEAATILAAGCVATAKKAMRCPGPRVEGVNTRFGLCRQRHSLFAYS